MGAPLAGLASPRMASPPARRLVGTARRLTPARLRAARASTRRWVRRTRSFLRAEWSSPVRLANPSLVVRGFQSDRRWLYPTPPSRANGYLSDVGYLRVVEGMNPASVQRVFNDKAAFARTLVEHGLGDAAPRALATVVDGRSQVLLDLPGPVVLKPVDGSGGKGVAVLPSLADALAGCPSEGSFLVQEKVVGHPYAAEIFPGSLNTLRVFALRDAPGAAPRVPVVVQRMGRQRTAPLDSFSAGGLLSRVDTATGRLSQAVGPVVRRGRDVFDHHPDTGARITGRVVAHLDEALDLVLTATRAFPEAVHLGWDIAISDRGPLIIEGNARRPAARSAQAHGPFALDPSCREFYQRWGLLGPGSGARG